MPFYELICISKPELTKDAFANGIKRAVLSIMGKEAVVHSINYMGLEPLPYRMRKNYEYQYFGRYWTLNFFSNPTSLLGIKTDLSSDPDIIRHRLIKRATKLPDLLQANIG